MALGKMDTSRGQFVVDHAWKPCSWAQNFTLEGLTPEN